MENKKLFKKWLQVTSIMWLLYIVIWWARCFVAWETINPFDWLIDIPNQDMSYRGGVLAWWFFITFIKYLIIFTTDIKLNTGTKDRLD